MERNKGFFRGSNVFFCFYIPFLESMQDQLITAQIWLASFFH